MPPRRPHSNASDPSVRPLKGLLDPSGDTRRTGIVPIQLGWVHPFDPALHWQIYYANTLTGRLSRDLPKDPGDDDVGLTAVQFGSRVGHGDDLGFAPPDLAVCLQTSGPSESVAINDNIDTVTLSSSMSAFQVSDTPHTTPVKPLPIPFDAGMARPRAHTDLAASPNRHPHRVPGVLFDSLTAQMRHRSNSTLDSSCLSLHRQRSDSSERTYSPNSNTYHLPVAREASHLNEPTRLSGVPGAQDSPHSESPHSSTCTIRQPLAPSTPGLVSELLQRTQQCIHSVVLHLKQFGIPQVAEDEEIVDSLMCATITAIRDLLYVSGPSFRHLCGKNKTERGDSDASQTPLVPAQRRAVATLSKFVLSARAVLNDGPWVITDSVSQLSSDADELERSMVEFVSIAQGVRSQGVLGPKQLHGYLTAPHADPAKAGAGTAGTWKGFGWVNVEDHEEAPRRNLTTATFNEFVNHISRGQEKLSKLTEALRATRPGISTFTSPFYFP